MNAITLICLIHDQPLRRAFPVLVGRTAVVAYLKELIKEKKKHLFDQVDASDLDLWRVSVPWVDEEGLREFQLKDGEALSPFSDVGEVFPEQPPKKHIHIIVKAELPTARLSTITPNETAELGRLRELEQRVMKSIHTFNLFFKPNQSTSTPWLVNTNTVTLTDLADLAAEITQAYRKVNDTALFTFEINGIKVAGPKTDADLRLLFQTLAARNLTTVTVDAKIGLKLFSEFKMEAVCTLYGLSYDPGNPLSQFPLFDCKAEDIDDELLSYVMDELNSRTLLTPVTQAPEAHQSIYVYCILHAIAKSFGSAFTILAGRYIEGLGAKGRVDYSIESRDGKILGVSEVKRQDYMQGIAQNAMQIRSALEYNNKGFDIGPRFGIATDADKWYFLEYTPHNAPRISKRYQAMFGGEFRREGVERIAGIINWLLLQSLEEESLLSDT